MRGNLLRKFIQILYTPHGRSLLGRGAEEFDLSGRSSPPPLASLVHNPGANGGRIKVQFIFMNTFESALARPAARKPEFTLASGALLFTPSSSTSTAARGMTKTVRSLAFTFVNHPGSTSRDLTPPRPPVCVFAMVIMAGEKNGEPEGSRKKKRRSSKFERTR